MLVVGYVQEKEDKSRT
jgi:hypothetical protein